MTAFFAKLGLTGRSLPKLGFDRTVGHRETLGRLRTAVSQRVRAIGSTAAVNSARAFVAARDMTRRIVRGDARFGDAGFGAAFGGAWDLLAVLKSADADLVMTAMGDPSLVVARSGDLAAIAAPAQRLRLSGPAAKRALGAHLAKRQRLLEAAHAAAPILPGAPRVSEARGPFADRAALERFLAANADLLRGALSEAGDREQHQVVVDLPDSEAMNRIKTGPAWGAISEAAIAGDTVTMVQRLSAAAAALRRELAETTTARLEALAVDTARLPLGDETTAVNLVVLTPRGGGAAIEAALEAVDADWNERLKIQLIGPGPATSFASVMVEPCDRRQVAAAEAALGVSLTDAGGDVSGATDPSTAPKGGDRDGAAVADAFRAAMKTAHPDIAGAEGAARTKTLVEANALMRRVTAARASLRAAGQAVDARGKLLLARLYREGDAVAPGGAAAQEAAVG